MIAAAPEANAVGESGLGAAEWPWLVVLVLLAAGAVSYFAGRGRPNT